MRSAESIANIEHLSIMHSLPETSHKTALFSAASHLAYPKSQALIWSDHNKCLYNPLIPYFSVVGLPPHADLDFRIVWEVQWRLQIG